MRLAHLSLVDSAGRDLIAAFAEWRRVAGAPICGGCAVPGPVAHPCARPLRLYPSGTEISIAQDLGAGASACRLDPAALDAGAETARRALSDATALVVIGKFGKHEASGGGFRDLLAEAVVADIPTLVGVPPLQVEAYGEFSQGLSTALDGTAAALEAWWAEASAR